MPWFRLLVLWIAMIAVPFQAGVAATMPACGSAHGADGAVVQQAEQVEHDGHDHDTHHMQGLGESDDRHSPAPSAEPAHQCATCGACHAAALTGPLAGVVLHDLPPADLAEPSFAMATRTPRVADRPPRA